MDRHYIIINTEDLDGVDFDFVCETSADTVRRSTDGTKCILKYNGDQPGFVYMMTGDTVGLSEYTHDDILTIINSEEWISSEEWIPNGYPEA